MLANVQYVFLGNLHLFSHWSFTRSKSHYFKFCGQRSVKVSYNLWSEVHCMQSVVCSLQSAVCSLQSAVCRQSANVRHRIESGKRTQSNSHKIFWAIKLTKLFDGVRVRVVRLVRLSSNRIDFVRNKQWPGSIRLEIVSEYKCHKLGCPK